MKHCIFLFLILFSGRISAAVFSAEADSTEIIYKKKLKSRFVFATSFATTESGVSLRSRSKSGRLDYNQNNPLKIGLNITAWFLYIPVSYSLPIDQGKGRKAQSFSVSPSYMKNALWIHTQFSYEKGFYLKNYAVLDPLYPEKNNGYFPLRNDLRIYTVSSSLTFVFNNKKFSSQAVYSFSEKQLKSRGSLLMGITSRYNKTITDSSLIPKSLVSDFAKDQAFTETAIAFAGVSFGYTHTFVFAKHGFLNITFLPSICGQGGYSKLTSGVNKTRHDWVTVGKMFGYASLGRNGDRSYWGVSVYQNSFRENPSGNNLRFTNTSVNVFLGFRILKWSKEQHPPVLKHNTASKFRMNEKVTWWANGMKRSGKITEVYKKEYYKVKSEESGESFIMEDFDLEKK